MPFLAVLGVLTPKC